MIVRSESFDSVSNSGLNTRCGNKRYLLASEFDRAALQDGPLGHMAHYQAPNEMQMLKNVLPIAAVALSDQGEQDLKQILGRLGQLRSLPLLPVLRLADGAGAEAMVIARLVAGPLSRLAGYASGLNSQLLEIKREREQLFENFRALEDAFNGQAMASVSCVFEHQPHAEPFDQGVGDVLADGGIIQLLPVASTGLAGFALHVRSTGSGGCGLRLRLEIVETETVAGEWLVTGEALCEGWNYFALPRALSTTAHSLQIRLDADGSGDSPEPSMGEMLAQDGFGAQAGRPHHDLDHRPLAFRLYAGIPGVRPDGILNMLATVAANDAPDVVAFRVPEEVLRAATLCTEVGPDVDFPLVRYLSKEFSVLCHPQLHGLTAAMLSSAVPLGTQWVQSRAAIPHSEGMPAYAAMLVLDPDMSLEDQLAALPPATSRMPSPGFSGWHQVKGGDPSEVLHLPIPDCLGRPRDLLLLSLPAGDWVTFSWLQFSDLRVARQFGLRS